ncbi:hypothetical protein HYFRA_00010737 [Hymenoscyphus fraxineus]|uniref:NAD(P)-binding protein n=1 Tax=Hymenoscyphus fraxineus TaxID=746836 RepID=A0A9N9L0M9_9HELO|nr:hypothetical protein HYFRA_00010737 [Hymenoscyphus fraxineus]
MSQTIYLITGANRGIGRGMTEALLQRPNTTILAGVRSPSHPTSQSLLTLPANTTSTLHLLALDVTSPSTLSSSLATLPSLGITHIDILISNAGISNYYGAATITPLEEVREHFEVNAIGTLALFQASWGLLKESKKERGPVVMVMSTGVASIGDMEKMPLESTAYGMSKVAVNYAVRKMHLENKELLAFVISPGWVQTEMGNQGAASMGMEEAPVSVQQSVEGVLKKLDNATRENTGGRFLSFDDELYSW